jgi:hypothetical protein
MSRPDLTRAEEEAVRDRLDLLGLGPMPYIVIAPDDVWIDRVGLDNRMFDDYGWEGYADPALVELERSQVYGREAVALSDVERFMGVLNARLARLEEGRASDEEEEAERAEFSPPSGPRAST